MSFTKHKEYILEAIDHLRARKSRPDCSRICKYLQKLYKVSPNEAKSSLRLCLKEKLVLKVEYKNNVSYRNAAKWKSEHKKSVKSSDSESKSDMSSLPAKDGNRIIVSALATLIYQNENYLEKGVPLEELIRTATAQSPKYSRKLLESIINKGIASGTLVSLYNGNLALGAGDHDADSVDSMRSDYNTVPMKRTRGRPRKGTVTYSVKAKVPNAGVRVGERRKMAKKVFDPSDNNVPIKRKRGRPLGSTNKNTEHNRKHKASSIAKSDNTDTTGGSQNSDENSAEEEHEDNYGESSGGVCSVCLMQKSRGSDKLVECRDCSNKAHYSCLQSGSGMLKLRPDSTWQCPHCKTCVICCETNDAGVLTVCSLCSDAYHALCHDPRIPERLKAWDHWECNNCLESRPTVARSPSLAPSNTIISSSFPIEAFLKPHEIDMSKSRKTNVPIDPSIPDICNWSTEEVYEYFKVHMPEAASALKDQDFDGQALKVARRKDIVTGLGLPLGRALKTYRIVVKLQTRKDDFTMCWG